MKSLRSLIEQVIQLGAGTTKYQHRVVAIHDNGELHPNVSEARDFVSLPNDPKLRTQHIRMHIERFHDKVKAQFPDWEHTTKFHPHEPLGSNYGTSWAENEETGEQIEFRHHFSKVT